MVIPIIEIPIKMNAALLGDYKASTVSEPIIEEASPKPGHSARYGVPLAFLEEYPSWKEYVIG